MMTIIFLVIFAIAAGLLVRSAVRAAQLKAQFKLFAVRDALVYLVASGEMQEGSRVFEHYYGRLNRLLKKTPNVGIDDLLRDILNYGGDVTEFDKTLKQAVQQMESLNNDKAMSLPSVAQAVAQYYESIQFLILTHSNWAKFMLYVFQIAGTDAQQKLNRILPDKAVAVGKTYRFAREEQRQIASNLCHV